ncbi:hypothetical protein D3C77_509030 [compost metagenome]
MEFVIPAAGDPAHRQPGFAQPGGEIRLLAKGGGAQHGRHGSALVAKAFSHLAGTGLLVQIGEHPLPVPVRQDLGQGFALEAPGPALVVFEAGGALGHRQARMAVLQQERLQSGGGLAGVIESEPPPQGVARQLVARYTPRGQLAAEPLVGLVKAAHPQPLVAAVARQVQRVAIYSRHCLDHWLPVAAITQQAVQQNQPWLVCVSGHG